LNEWSACRRSRYLHNTQQTQWPNMHAIRKIRTRDPSRPPLRPHCHRVRQQVHLGHFCMQPTTLFHGGLSK